MSESVPTVPVSPQYRRGCASRMAIPLTSSPTKLMAVIQCVTRTTAEWCISVARRNSSIPFPDLLTWSTVGRSLSLVGASNQLTLWQRWVRQPQNIWFRRALFQVHLWTGSDLGESVPTGLWLVSSLLDLHDNLLAGETGRQVNGVGALAVLALAATGLVIWWPGIKTWRRSLTVDRGLGWKRLIWHLHSMIGLWSLGFITVFAVSGIYLGIPQP